MRKILTLSAIVLFSASSFATGAFAQDASSLDGQWQDSFGTSLSLSACGDGTEVCAVLTDVQGESRTEANLAYVDRQIMQAVPTGENQWQGTVIFDGNEAEGTVTQVSADTIEIQGCRLILCDTLTFTRI